MLDNNGTAIKVSDVSKSFKLPHEKNTSIKSFVTNPFRKRKFEKQRVLKDISFEIKKGEFFGIVGRNGSGKSTLLKLLAGIYSPDKGHIQINGKLTPFIELGVGFNPELTGRENVYLNGALLGFNRKEMTAMYDEIVEFAELKKFMDQKLKNYSSGMQVRLAFSIAIRADTDILVLDEVLAVGDASFQLKCQEYFIDLKNRKKTVVLVTHDMNAVDKFCDRAMLINNGSILKFGNTREVEDAYNEINNDSTTTLPNSVGSTSDNGKIENGAEITEVKITNQSKKEVVNFKHLEEINISVKYKINKPIKGFVADIGLTLGQNGQTYVYSDTSRSPNMTGAEIGEIVTVNFSMLNIFSSGSYFIVSSIYDPKTLKVYARSRNLGKIKTNNPPFSGVVAPEHKLSITYEKAINK